MRERKVSIQLVSPASGDDKFGGLVDSEVATIFVSIQLVSPASGDTSKPTCTTTLKSLNPVSIQLVSPASGDNTGFCYEIFDYRFHSISFPSEWGQRFVSVRASRFRCVSIQLVSPASGD